MEQKELTEIWKKIIQETELDEEKKLTLSFLADSSKLVEISDKKSRMTVVLDNDFTKILFENEYADDLLKSIELILNTNLGILFLTKEEWKNKRSTKENIIIEEKTEEITASDVHQHSALNKKFIFENFVMSNSNKMLVQAALAIASLPGEAKWNPFFIYGGSGLGKTHLLHAIGNKIRSQNNRIKIKYIEAKDFGNIVHNAVMSSNTSETLENIKSQYNSYNILLIDDIQMISSWGKAKEIFYAIFSYFINNKKQIVITSDQYIDELKEFEERFITRFQGGLSIGIVPPDVDTSKKIIRQKLKDLHDFNVSNITDEAIEYIAVNFGNNVRDLEGAVNRIIFWTIQKNEESIIKMADIVEIFQGISTNKTKGITINRVISVIASYYGIPKSEILGKSRKAEIMMARHISIYFARTLLEMSLIEIGRAFHRDHSTIISSINKIKRDLEKSPDLSVAIYDLRKKISEGK